MLDPQLLRHDLQQIVRGMERRGLAFAEQEMAALEQRRRALRTEVEQWRHERNRCSRDIGAAKAKQQDPGALLQQVNELGAKLEQAELTLQALEQQWQAKLLELPNLPHASVPEGSSSEQNAELRRCGEPPQFDFTPRDHATLGEALGMMDFKAAAAISGARFVVLHGLLARLHRALIAFMLDLHTAEHGYQELNVPYLVAAHSMEGTGQLPKFREDLFATENGLYLIPTAEVPVTNLVRERVLSAAELPLRYVCHTPCFRREAGSYGQDTHGMIRQHQFEKVELVQIVRPETSYDTLEQLTSHAEEVLRRLELPYRVVSLCGGDLGFAAAKTYDLEVWLPAQQRYREISSCSNFEAFQARRLRARWRNPGRNPGTGNLEPVHTLNGSGLAVGRTLVALLENCQRADGSIAVPAVLQPYLDGRSVLTASD